jgi:uncharacterized protein involved in response to NO
MPLERPRPGIALLSAGFRPFFLLAAGWAAFSIPVWLAAYVHGYSLRGSLPAIIWHAHEMVYGFGVAAVAGFLLTAIPNWTGRLPLRGAPLGWLAGLWLAGRAALLLSENLGAAVVAAIDLAFLATLIAVIARELVAGRNWRNLPMVAALSLLFAGSLLVHLHALGVAYEAALGNRIGIATLLALIALVGGRIVPSFTRNWLARARPHTALPAPAGRLDAACLLATLAGLIAWTAAPDSKLAGMLELAGGVAAGIRLSRWRGLAVAHEPLLFVLHAGYAWLALGMAVLGLDTLFALLPTGAALHVLTVGAVGTMTLAVMTRATLGHTGRPLEADAPTCASYVLVTLAALLRLGAAFPGAYVVVLASLAGVAWSLAFVMFAWRYGPMLLAPRAP